MTKPFMSSLRLTISMRSSGTFASEARRLRDPAPRSEPNARLSGPGRVIAVAMKRRFDPGETLL